MEHLLTLTSFVFFTGLVGVVTWWLTRKDDHASSGGYFLAGRTLTGGYIAGSLLLTNLSTEQLVGLNGSAYVDGLCVMAWEVVAAVSLVVLALIFLPRYLKSGIATVPEFLEERFDKGTRTLTTLIFLLAYTIIVLPMILYTGARGMTGILDMHQMTGIKSDVTIIWIMVWLIGILGSIYAIFGGLRTVAVSDTLNGFGLLTGGILIAVLSLMAVSNSGPLEGLEVLKETHPEKFNSLGSSTSSVPFSTLFTGVLLLNLFYWTTNQQIIQRTFGAKNLAEGQKGVLIAGVFKMLAPIILVIPGMAAFHLYGIANVDGRTVPVAEVTSDPVTAICEGESGQFLKVLEGEDLDSAQSQIGTEQTADDGKTYTIASLIGSGVVVVQEEGKLVSHPELTAASYIAPRERDKAYGRIVQRVLPWYLRGFFAAVVVGAILSSFNSVLNSSATLFSLGVYRDMLHPNATDKQVIDSGKWFGTIVAIASMSVAPLLMGQESIFGYLQKMNGMYFIPIFSVIVVGLTTRRVPALAAKIGLVGSFLLIIAVYFIPPVTQAFSFTHDFHFLGLVFAGSVVLMLVIGAAIPMPVPYEQKPSGKVDLTPWKPAWPVGITLALIVLAIYIYLADVSVLSK